MNHSEVGLADEQQAVLDALLGERTVDILTTGARTGLARTTEIWTTIIAGEVFICGTPAAGVANGDRKPRDWLANLAANSALVVRLKSSVHVDLAARAEQVHDADQRRRILSSPAAEYYRTNAESIDHAVRESPIVRLRFVDDDAWLNDALRAAAADRS